jgi:hypothetical protein
MKLTMQQKILMALGYVGPNAYVVVSELYNKPLEIPGLAVPCWSGVFVGGVAQLVRAAE